MKDNDTKRLSRLTGTVYSIYTDYESDHTKPYTTILGCSVVTLNSIPEGMVGKSFDGGNLERAFSADFEVFGEKAQNPTDTEIDFLIAVK